MCGFFIKLALHVGKPLLYTAWVVNDAKFEVTEFVCSRPTQLLFFKIIYWITYFFGFTVSLLLVLEDSVYKNLQAFPRRWQKL